MALTGKFEFRKSLRGKIVLRVEEEVKPFWSKPGAVRQRWRDATPADLATPERHYLIDRGLKPGSRLQSPPAPGKTPEQQRSEKPVQAEASGPIQQAGGVAH